MRSLFVFKKLFFQQLVGVRPALEGHHGSAWFAAQFAEQVFKGVFEFLGSSVDRQFQAGGFMGDRNRLVAFWPRFQLAAQIMGTRLVAILVPQVNLDAGQVLLITFERALNGGSYPLLQSDAALNMVIDSSSLISASSREAGQLSPWASSP